MSIGQWVSVVADTCVTCPKAEFSGTFFLMTDVFPNLELLDIVWQVLSMIWFFRHIPRSDAFWSASDSTWGWLVIIHSGNRQNENAGQGKKRQGRGPTDRVVGKRKKEQDEKRTTYYHWKRSLMYSTLHYERETDASMHCRTAAFGSKCLVTFPCYLIPWKLQNHCSFKYRPVSTPITVNG